jgi:hypothetical protein
LHGADKFTHRSNPTPEAPADGDVTLKAFLKEVEMLLHLPIAILATLAPIPVSDAVPRFDIAKECRFESESSKAFDRCSHDESDALAELQKQWPEFVGADRNTCFTEATVAGFSSYVELLICLQMSRDVDNVKTSASDSTVGQSTRPPPPEVSVVDKPE